LKVRARAVWPFLVDRKVKESAYFLVVGGTGIEPVTPAV
jgi:hypothetical protein